MSAVTVGRATVARPDHGRVRRAQRRQRLDRVLDVRRRRCCRTRRSRARARPAPRPCTRRCRDASPLTTSTFGRRDRARRVAVARVELDEPRLHVGGAGMTVERADQVVALARAHADDADRPGRAPSRASRGCGAGRSRAGVASELSGASYARCQSTQSSVGASADSLSPRAPSRSSRPPRAPRAAPSARSARSRCRRGRRGTSRSSTDVAVAAFGVLRPA